jgi:hypothetical protein
MSGNEGEIAEINIYIISQSRVQRRIVLGILGQDIPSDMLLVSLVYVSQVCHRGEYLGIRCPTDTFLSFLEDLFFFWELDRIRCPGISRRDTLSVNGFWDVIGVGTNRMQRGTCRSLIFA